MSKERELIRTLLEPYCTSGQLRGNCGALTSDIYDLINDPKVRREDALIAGLDIVLRQVVAPEYQNKIREKINSALTTARKEAREEAVCQIDEFRKSGCNITFWCTPRAVVTQITFHDEDASPDVDKSFQSFSEALDFAIEAAANNKKGENDATD